ncbi:MAG: peptidase S41, partial [candidate division Zixibacteria bacterium]|nr:peptidase S41 [candidate division Zixibacteria bacterium]
AEDFVVPFKDNGRAIIIGEPTGGSTGQPYMYNFGNGIRIGIGTKRAYMPDGSKFEGVGVEPDIEVKLIREDLYKDKDRVLEKAVKEANRLLIQ